MVCQVAEGSIGSKINVAVKASLLLNRSISVSEPEALTTKYPGIN